MSEKTIASIVLAAAMIAGPALSQPAAPVATCPPSGFAAPLIGVFGGNDGIQHPREIQGPCTPPKVADAIMAMGMARLRPLGIKAVMSVRFSATGTWIDPVAGPVKLENVNWDNHYYAPGVRAELRGVLRNGKPFSNVEVFAEDRAWDETAPGVGPKAAPKGALQERAVWPKLFPFGAMLSIVEAEGSVKVGQAPGGQTTLTGKSPYEPYTVTVTLDAKNMVDTATVSWGGHTYKAAFIGYNDVTQATDPVRNKWEPAYMVPWPDRIVWSKDGKPYADFTTTAMKSNAYMAFPFPELMKAEAEEADLTYGYDKNNPGTDIRDQFFPDMREKAGE